MTAAVPKPRRLSARPVKLKVPDKALEGVSEVFKLLGDKCRLKILLALAERELHVSALADLLQQSQSAVSHHLLLLRLRNLIGVRRSGKHNYYRLESGLVRDLLDQFFTETGNGGKLLQFEGFSLAYKEK